MESVIVMVPYIAAEDNSHEDDDLINADEYLDIARTQKTDYMKRLRIRRLICRVCRLKFKTRQETQDHIKSKHRKAQVNG